MAQLIVKAAERSQVWIVTHSRDLAGAISESSGIMPREVVRTDDGTWLEGLSQMGVFADE